MSLGCPWRTSNPERMIGLAPRPDDPAGDEVFLSDVDGDDLPPSGAGVVMAGVDDFLPGVTFPDFLSSELSELDFDEGRTSSDFLVSTLFSYGLNARCLISGVVRGFSCLAGGVLFVKSTLLLLLLLLFFLSWEDCGKDLLGGESAPI